MKKNEVNVGGVYIAKVSDKLVSVRIDAVKGTGWSATNLATGRRICIRSAQRLLGEAKDGAVKTVAKKATTPPTSATGAKNAAKATTKAKPKKAPARAKQGQRKAKRVSGLDAAARVLAESGEPMTCRQIVEVAFEKGYWKSGGAKPWATIYSAMIRETSAKGKDSRVQKVDRGKFTVNLRKKA